MVLFAGCSGVQQLHVTSDPSGAFLKANQQNVGATPLLYEYDTTVQPRFTLTAEKEGYFPESILISPASAAVREGQVKLVLRPNSALQETTTSNATNTWLRVQINPAITADNAWQRIVDIVTTYYDSLEQLDVLSGYIRSTPRERRWDFGDPRGPFFVRTQFLGSISSKEPLVYKFKLKAESRWGNTLDWLEYDRVFKRDAELIEELTNRLGIK